MKLTQKALRKTLGHYVIETYLIADSHQDLSVWHDFSAEIVDHSFRYEVDAAPIARIQCPGIENIEANRFTDGFVTWSDDLDAYIDTEGRMVGGLKDVIHECVRDRDVDNLRREMEAALVMSAAGPTQTQAQTGR